MAIRIGSQQLKIMRVLWRDGDATAKHITEDLSKSEPVAHSTIQTLLRKLQAKGAVTHEGRERTFYFRALVSEDEIAQTATQDLIGKVFNGSLSGLVAHVLENEDVSAAELNELKRLIDEKSKELK